MREYETVFIVQPDISDSERSKIGDKLSSLIEKHSGRLFYARQMGKKTLAYPIGRQTRGFYTCLDYVANNTAVEDLERSLRLDENVIRFLTTVKNHDVDVEARAAEIIAKGEDSAEAATEEQAAPASLAKSDDDVDEIDVDSKEE